MDSEFLQVKLFNGNPSLSISVKVSSIIRKDIPYLCIPESVALQLCLPINSNDSRVAELNSDRASYPYVGPILIEHDGKYCFTNAIVAGNEVILGSIPTAALTAYGANVVAMENAFPQSDSDSSSIFERLLKAHNFAQLHGNGSALYLDAANELQRKDQTINDLAMLMRMLLSERNAERKAKEYLTQHGLMGSPLRVE